jgi:protease I
MLINHVAPGRSEAALRAIVLTADKFEDLELLVPYFRLREAGVHVDVAAPTRAEIGGEHGYRFTPDLTIDEVDPNRYGLLLIPGGFPDGAPATVRDHVGAQAVCRAFFADAKAVATICHGPWLLASSGVATARHVTSYWEDGVPEDLRAAGANWEDAPVVVDGNLVSSRWPPDLPAFTDAMMALIASSLR